MTYSNPHTSLKNEDEKLQKEVLEQLKRGTDEILLEAELLKKPIPGIYSFTIIIFP
jgi:hypothetical protein